MFRVRVFCLPRRPGTPSPGALGEAGVNIGTFHLGRKNDSAEAVLLLSVDEAIPDPVLVKICRLPGVKTAKALGFA